MEKRTKVGLLFSYDENWIGGTYYILNLIKALKAQDDSVQPQLVIFSTEEKNFDKIKALDYPYIAYQLVALPGYNLVEKVINKLYRSVAGENIITKNTLESDVSILFPGDVNYYFEKSGIPQLFWIPDLQDLHLPDFFSKKELEQNRKPRVWMEEQHKNILFSSYDSLKDFTDFYGKHEGERHVLNFAVTHPPYRDLKIEELLEKHQISQPYFFIPNQFWKHKNHRVVFDALKYLKEQGQLDFTIAMSGKEYDYRNPTYFDELKQFVQENKLEGNTRFLGFIDRSEQLKLMSQAIGIIQPSLFEGWSTVVEDGKAMNQTIIASNLAVHKEQLLDQGYFFEPKNHQQLADILVRVKQANNISIDFQYPDRIKKFGQDFIKIINQLVKN